MRVDPVENLLSRVQGVKASGAGKWMARCPAHQDKSPSLSIRESDSGSVLVNCFAGCSVHDITAAVGLELSDLFPDSDERQVSKPQRYSPREVVEVLTSASRIVVLGYQRLASGGQLAEPDVARVKQAIRTMEECFAKVRG